MNPWLVVFAIWFLMLVVVLLVARTAGSRPARTEDEVEDSYDNNHKPNAAWSELDTQNARYGAGRPLQ